MPIEESVPTMVGIVALCVTAVAVVAWMFDRVAHQSHLRQAEQDHRRLHRLSTRLAGCVIELEEMLEDGLPIPGPGLLPDSVAGHMVYLFGLREECDLFLGRTQWHNALIGWPQAHLRKASVSGQRCAEAHVALARAADALRGAARVYEEGFVVAHRRLAGGRGSRAPGESLLVLPNKRASELLTQRKSFDEQMRLVATHACRRRPFFEQYRCSWPVMTSERQQFDGDPYCGEVRPLGRHGFGPVPVLHPDAR